MKHMSGNVVPRWDGAWHQKDGQRSRAGSGRLQGPPASPGNPAGSGLPHSVWCDGRENGGTAGGAVCASTHSWVLDWRTTHGVLVETEL